MKIFTGEKMVIFLLTKCGAHGFITYFGKPRYSHQRVASLIF